MLITDLLIFYCPGSRGDFLASVLTDSIDQYYQQYRIAAFDIRYNKMHGINEDNNPWDHTLNEESILQNRSIRIKIAPEDYAIVAQMTENKGLSYTYSESLVSTWEKRYSSLDNKFKFIVRFADLFDINFLKDFYQQFNGRPIPAKLVPMIEYNITLQFNYTPLLRTRFQIYQHRRDH